MRRRLVVALLPLLALAPGALAATAAGPTASFTTSPAHPYVQATVSFDGSASAAPSGATISSYTWTFGDGSTATTATPTTTHAYATPATYTARLTVTDNAGQSSPAAVQTVRVAADVPEAHFTVGPRTRYTGRPVTFNGAKSTDPAGNSIVSYTWSFGDGSTVTTATPKTTHVYSQAGSFSATLVVADSAGNRSAAKARTITVETAPSKPLASFTSTPTQPVIGTTVRFDGSASSVPGATITAYMWNFGDGATATTTTPVAYHVYTAPGVKTVRLVVLSSQGKHGAAEQTVTVVKPALSGLRVRVCARRTRRCHRVGLEVRFRLNAADTVVLTVRPTRRHRVVKHVVVHETAGRHTVQIGLRGRAGSRYVVRAVPAGGEPQHRRFRWR